MRLKLTILIFVGLAANNCICQSSLNLLGVHITWNNLGDRTEFNVTSSLSPGVDVNDAWIGVGLNNETSMRHGNVIICRNGQSVKDVSHYLNTPLNIPILFDPSNPKLGLNLTKVGTEQGNLTCSFTRENENTKSAPGYFTIDDLSAYHVIVAYGQGNLSYHFGNRQVSEKISFGRNAVTMTTGEPSSLQSKPTTQSIIYPWQSTEHHPFFSQPYFSWPFPSSSTQNPTNNPRPLPDGVEGVLLEFFKWLLSFFGL